MIRVLPQRARTEISGPDFSLVSLILFGSGSLILNLRSWRRVISKLANILEKMSRRTCQDACGWRREDPWAKDKGRFENDCYGGGLRVRGEPGFAVGVVGVEERERGLVKLGWGVIECAVAVCRQPAMESMSVSDSRNMAKV